MKIVVLDGYGANPGDLSWEAFEKLGELTVYDRTPAELTIERIGEAEAAVTDNTVISRAVLEACPKLKYVGVLATGYNTVDVEAAREKGIPVTNIPAYGTEAVAQFTLALLLEICHHVGSHSDGVKAGRWSKSSHYCYWDYPLIELAGKTMGIIGFGRIGQAAARMAQGFGMKVLAYSQHPNPALENENQRYVTLPELLAASDVISLHCPLFPSTKGIINKDSIAKMKDGVILLNTARGALINEEDLRAALLSGKVAYAGVDVASSEPISEDNPLMSAPNCFITPHIAWAPRESRARLMDIAAENLKAFMAGSPQNVVNP